MVISTLIHINMGSREEINAYNGKYHLEHREQMLLRNKEKYKRRKGLQDEYSREWHGNHAEEAGALLVGLGIMERMVYI